MRVFAVIVLAVLGLVGQGQACSAQGTPPKEARPAPAVGRIGTLSPDEARRAARARKRAEAAGKVAPTPAASPAPAAKVHVQAAAVAPPRIKPVAPRARRLAQEPRQASPRSRLSERRRPTSSPDARHAHLRMQTPPTRRLYADRPRWNPQVGDVVPRGVLLYRSPPYQPYYPDGPIYVPVGPPTAYQPYYPPYPGAPEGY